MCILFPQLNFALCWGIFLHIYIHFDIILLKFHLTAFPCSFFLSRVFSVRQMSISRTMNLWISFFISAKVNNFFFLKKISKFGGLRFISLKTYYNAIVINTVWYWDDNRHIEQWNRIESPGINSNICDQLIFLRECQDHLMGKECPSQ